MQYTILENGNLQLTLEDNEVADVEDLLEKASDRDHGFLCELLDYAGLSTNGHLYPVLPHQVGALTDAPIISDEVVYEDDGTVNVPGKVWWFPGYELRSFAEELLRDQQVIFTASPENQNKA
jgi:hypothetical protein